MATGVVSSFPGARLRLIQIFDRVVHRYALRALDNLAVVRIEVSVRSAND
jgi:hypothetical protein